MFKKRMCLCKESFQCFESRYVNRTYIYIGVYINSVIYIYICIYK